MNDLLSFIKPKRDQYMTATYYARRPVLTSDIGVKFRYKKVDPRRYTFEQPLQNVYTDGSVTAIRTNADLPFKITGYVVTQDGALWQIAEIENHEDNSAFHLDFKNCIDDEVVLRLISVENEEELGNTGI